MWRFEAGPIRTDTLSQIWLNTTHREIWDNEEDTVQKDVNQIPDSVQDPPVEPSFLSGLSALTSLWTGENCFLFFILF
jgi:hypothetical protein